MKTAIIGSNPNAANFLNDVEFIKDFANADTIIFTDTLNYRSAVTKLNKISSDKLVIGIGNACNFLAKQYKCTLFPVQQVKKSTIPCYFREQEFVEEVYGNITNCFIPSCKYRVIGMVKYLDFNFGAALSTDIAGFIGEYHIPVIIELVMPDKPRCLLISLDSNFLNNSNVKNIINSYICI